LIFKLLGQTLSLVELPQNVKELLQFYTLIKFLIEGFYPLEHLEKAFANKRVHSHSTKHIEGRI